MFDERNLSLSMFDDSPIVECAILEPAFATRRGVPFIDGEIYFTDFLNSKI